MIPGKNLHSILVKSIPRESAKHHLYVVHLHSILVKSIHGRTIWLVRSFFIYIPFWLNLYKIAQDLPDAPDRIYIPFWLNLYRVRILLGSGNAQIYIPFWLNLYSADTELGAGSYQIYIPFWLNLYVCRIGRCLMLHLFTFHSG